MSVAELFQHQHVFIGGLAVRRIKRHKPGRSLTAGDYQRIISAQDAEGIANNANALLFPAAPQADYDFALVAQAMAYESLQRCPALGEDNQCLIHHHGKPQACAVVPFDPILPDSLQAVVLLSRGFAENCIVAGEQSDFAVVADHNQVLSDDYASALQQRRSDLQLEKIIWGQAVFNLLQQQGFWQSADVMRLSEDNGVFCLSLVPVLMVLASVSKISAERCLQYANSQMALLDKNIELALQRKNAADKSQTKLFRMFNKQLAQFKQQLSDSSLQPLQHANDWSNAVESYLFKV